MLIRNSRPRRPSLAALLAALFAGSITPQPCKAADDAHKIAWRENLAQAQAEAKSRDMLLWIQFTGPWCINCRRMERSAFVHGPIVTESRERFVPVKVRSDEYEALAQSLELTGLPSTVIARPNGEIVDKFEGYGDPEEFEGFLKVVLKAEGRSPEQVAAKALAKAKKDAALAMSGYCPVTLLKDQKLVPGKPDLTAEHAGRVYRFASADARAAFRQKPDSYAPANDGRCPVSLVDRGDFQAGDPRWGVVYSGHLFLFKDGADQARFAKDPQRYALIDVADRSSCPHCWSQSRLARRSPTRFSATYPIPDSPVLATSPARLDALLMPADTVRR